MWRYIPVLIAFAASGAAGAQTYRWIDERGVTNPGVQVRGLPFDTYIRLNRGMSEGELLSRTGSPDYVSIDARPDITKSFYYYPTGSDPFTTVVTLRGGRIDSIERTKKH